jgi:cell wall assembly regulator SMI1
MQERDWDNRQPTQIRSNYIHDGHESLGQTTSSTTQILNESWYLK